MTVNKTMVIVRNCKEKEFKKNHNSYKRGNLNNASKRKICQKRMFITKKKKRFEEDK